MIGDVKVDIIGSFESRHDADKFEKELHRNYAEYRLPRCIPEEFTNGLSKVKTKMGITEWFSHEVLELMKENNGYTY